MPRRRSPSPASILPPSDQPLNTVQAADILGITPGWLAHLRSQGKGPAFCRVGKTVRYFLKDVLDWLKSNRVETA